jgi:hypothetical protein
LVNGNAAQNTDRLSNVNKKLTISDKIRLFIEVSRGPGVGGAARRRAVGRAARGE